MSSNQNQVLTTNSSLIMLITVQTFTPKFCCIKNDGALLHSVDGSDIGMVQGCKCVGFSPETLDACRVFGKSRR